MFLILILIALLFPLKAEAFWPFDKKAKNIKYEIKINGIDEDTDRWLKKLKLTQMNKDNPPMDIDQLRQEAGTLSDRIKKALNAKGYYDAVIFQKLVEKNDPPLLQYDVKPGQRYVIGNISLEWPDKSKVKRPDFSKLGAKKGEPVDAAVILKDAGDLQAMIGKNACLLSLEVNPVLQITGSTHKADLIFKIDHGPQANFGEVVISGNKEVDDDAVLRAVSWKKGECYDVTKVTKTSTGLIQSQLFSSVTVEADEAPDTTGEVPMKIFVKERVPRTITAGANYSTDEGIGVNFGWEHRNYFGAGEKLSTDLTLAELKQEILATLKIPGFKRKDQTLTLNSGFTKEDTDAYSSESIDTGIGIERPLLPSLNGGIGIGYSFKVIEDVLTGTSEYALLSLPTFLEFDNRDNPLDATKGALMRLGLTPYTETFGEGGRFMKTQITGQTYISADTKFDPTLALRFSVGSIAGQSGNSIPSDIRFYAGGSGSVRGYSYQSLGPRVNDTPVGGSSLLEGTVEFRMRFTETVGAVAFVDVGNTYNAQFPQYNEKLYYGVGTGIRYYSPIGPLRMDVALPVNGGDIEQTGVQFYVSIGQAF